MDGWMDRWIYFLRLNCFPSVFEVAHLSNTETKIVEMFLLRSNATIQAVIIYFEECNAPTQPLQYTQGLTTIASLQRHSNKHECFVKKRAAQALSLSLPMLSHVFIPPSEWETHEIMRVELNWTEMNSTQIIHQLNYHFLPMSTCSDASPELLLQSIATESTNS